MNAAAKHGASSPDWSDAHRCVEKIRHVLRERPTLAEAVELSGQCRPCLRMIDGLSRTLDDTKEDAMRDLVARAQAAIEQYADYEQAIATEPCLSRASRARQVRDRSDFWLSMVKAVDRLEKSIRTHLE